MYYSKLVKYQNKLVKYQKGGVNPIVGYHNNIGGREYQEDRISVLAGNTGPANNKRDYMILSVFDGHGGADTSEYLLNLPARCKALLDANQEPLSGGLIKGILNNEFARIDQEATPEMRKPFTGSTACVCIVFDMHIFVANIADSPAIIFDRSGDLVRKTNIHDCNNPLERARVDADFEVPFCEDIGSGLRLNLGELPSGDFDRGLDMTRAFGDNAYKPKSNAVPEINVWYRVPGQILCICSDSFLDRRLDGLANKQNEQDIVNEIFPALHASNFNPQVAVEAIVNRRATTIPNSDNTSMILAIL